MQYISYGLDFELHHKSREGNLYLNGFNRNEIVHSCQKKFIHFKPVFYLCYAPKETQIPCVF